MVTSSAFIAPSPAPEPSNDQLEDNDKPVNKLDNDRPVDKLAAGSTAGYEDTTTNSTLEEEDTKKESPLCFLQQRPIKGTLGISVKCYK